MPTLENDPMPTSQGGNSNYNAVRFNAMQHGILSRYTVLSHEDADEYQVLLSALLEEHQPAGATEAHLVEELAATIWRKRRVLQAEGARIDQSLKDAVRSADALHAPPRGWDRKPIEGLQVHLLEKLTRYEVHLDRKFERTLAMLLKLRELRGNCSGA